MVRRRESAPCIHTGSSRPTVTVDRVLLLAVEKATENYRFLTDLIHTLFAGFEAPACPELSARADHRKRGMVGVWQGPVIIWGFVQRNSGAPAHSKLSTFLAEHQLLV